MFIQITQPLKGRAELTAAVVQAIAVRLVDTGFTSWYWPQGARCSSVVRAFAHGAMGHRIDPSWWTH